MLTSCAMTRLSHTTRLSSTSPARWCRRCSSVPTSSTTRLADAAVRVASISRSACISVAMYARVTNASDEHRHDRRGDKRDEQLAIEAGAHLAQQRAAGRRRPGGDEAVDEPGEQEHARRSPAAERDELGEADEVPERARPADSPARRCAPRSLRKYTSYSLSPRDTTPRTARATRSTRWNTSSVSGHASGPDM